MTTNRNTKKKPTVDAVANTNKAEVPVVTEVEVAKPKKFDNEDVIPCRSISAGVLVMTGARSGNPYQWFGIDDVIEVEYRDLIAEVRSRSNYITEPFFVVDDADFVAQNPILKEIYENLYPVKDLTNIFRLDPKSMTDTINKLPKGAKETVKSLAATYIQEHRIDSLRTIQALSNIFNCNFEYLTEDDED